MANHSETETLARYWSARRAFERVLIETPLEVLALKRGDEAEMLAALELWRYGAPEDPAGEPEFLVSYWRAWHKERGLPELMLADIGAAEG